MKRNCSKCKKEFEESQLELSHDVPCYMFPGNTRRERKNHADKYGRRYLCKPCHDKYENIISVVMFRSLQPKHQGKIINLIKKFAKGYFNGNTR